MLFVPTPRPRVSRRPINQSPQVYLIARYKTFHPPNSYNITLIIPFLILNALKKGPAIYFFPPKLMSNFDINLDNYL